MVTAGYRLNEGERAQLVAIQQMPGFKILMNLFEAEISQLQVDMINADPVEREVVLAKHNLAKAAAVFYARTVERMNSELEVFANYANETKIQPDITEALFSE